MGIVWKGERKMRGVVILLIALLSMVVVHAWGSSGHMVVADVAYTLLDTTTKAKVDALLHGAKLSDLANWPDKYVNTVEGKWSAHLHFVNLPSNVSTFVCSPACDDGCVVTALTNFTRLLQSQEGSSCANYNNHAAIPCPLSFVTHFMGDIHQPLHVAYGVDRGGVFDHVYYNHTHMTLHKLWDYGMINSFTPQSNWQALSAHVIAYIKKYPSLASAYQSVTSFADMANESFQYARQACYNRQPGTLPLLDLLPVQISYIPKVYDYVPSVSTNSCDFVPSQEYYQRNMENISFRLMAAAIRLANTLHLALSE